MHDDRRMVESRLERAVSQFVHPARYPLTVPLRVSAWHAPGEPVPVQEALKAEYTPFEVGGEWGGPWSTTWFRFHGEVPGDWAGRRVEALLDLGYGGVWPGFNAEALVHDLDGIPVKGIHRDNRWIAVAAEAVGGEQVRLLAEAAANPDILGNGFRPTALGDRLTGGDTPLYRLGRAELAVLDEQVFHLDLDIEVLSGLMHELSTDDPRRHEILRALERMLDVLDLHDVPGTALVARTELADVLARPAHASAHRLSAVGHAHIDSAWLWPLRETVRKTARTFANVTALAQDYPELVFACSQAQQYAWTRDHQPQIWQRIKDAVAAGNWAPVGSMWVESDTNMPGGEALARQLVHGKRFFLDELGVETEEVWLPDSFGYTAAFPQLARLAGVRWFLSQKMSWNETNRMPHHSFWWEGIDGSRVFTHFPPVDTYNATVSGNELARAVRTFSDKGLATRSLLPFGYGDGGGGPTREMLERARRVRDLEGSPRLAVEPPSAFFAAAEAEYGAAAPVWSGEMYLELHRATYTTQAATKRGNRRSEHLLREAELWAASFLPAAEYPYRELDRLWKTVLLHQFHDILPGSSIAWVHREARETYRAVAEELEGLIASACGVGGGGGGGGGGGDAQAVRILNASSFDRAEVLDGQWAQAPALGVGTLSTGLPAGVAPVRATTSSEGTTVTVLDNGLLRVTVTADGLLSSVLDLTGGGDGGGRDGGGREALAPGTYGNLLQLHPDHPSRWDAWDIDRHYRRRWTDLTAAESVTVESDGPMSAAVRVERAFGDSRIVQLLTLDAGSPRLLIDTDIDWQESEKVLKAAFPLDVHADRSSSEIQFGHVQRPTHTNTSWDAARFEICAHRWVHVGEPGYGIAVVNDSTYGHDISRDGSTTTVRLTLLRSPHSPDPETDTGRHRFRYALQPGATLTDAVAAGHALNLPLRRTTAAPTAPLISLDSPAIAATTAVVESVKLADDRSGDVIVRLYESLGARTTCTLRPNFTPSSATLTDLLERPTDPLTPGVDGTVALPLRPFQILTVRLRRERE